MELLSAVTQDTRFMDAYNKRIEEGGTVNMEAWIDEAENRGIEKGKIEIVLEMLREKQPMDLIARVSKFSIERIAEIGKLHGIL